jgi:guanylate kinase
MQREMERNVSQQQRKSPPSPRQGLLFVLSAPSGTGKDTVINAARAMGMDFFVVPSVTTRQPRPGESEGNPYHFVSQETFEELEGTGELL